MPCGLIAQVSAIFATIAETGVKGGAVKGRLQRHTAECRHKIPQKVNNRGVEYAVAGGVAVLFVVLYLLVKPVRRESFCEPLDEKQFAEGARRLAEIMPPPERGGKDVNAAKYARKVKKAANARLGDEDEKYFGRLYAPFCEHREEIESLCKTDFSHLADLPYTDGMPRTVKIADFVLSHSKYLLAEDRLDAALSAVTEKTTLTFDEMRAFPVAVRFCILKKLASAFDASEKMRDIAARARRIAAHPARAESSSDFRALKRNAVFNRVCAEKLGYEGATFAKTFGDLADETIFYTENCFLSLQLLTLFDFSQYYNPFKIIAKYEVLKKSDDKIITAFFNALSRQSERENLDETAYALRLENYIDKGFIPPLIVRTLGSGKRRISVVGEKDDIVTLARALTSDTAMQLAFGAGTTRGKSVEKLMIKSPKPPKTLRYTIAMGISERNGNLTVNPVFPSCVTGARLGFVYDGVHHGITFEKGETRTMTVNGTAMFGVPSVRLGSIPLDIKIGFTPVEESDNS